MSEKPLAAKAYGHIPHLPGSRMGIGDHHCHEGQARICTEKVRDRHDEIIVQEKLDGSCVAVARIGDALYALGRAGYLAIASPYEQHHLFAQWVSQSDHYERFMAVLNNGERIVGEWLVLAHGTRYRLPHEPFVAFDIMTGKERLPYDAFAKRVLGQFTKPWLVHRGGPLSIEDALRQLGQGRHGALDPVEGAVWRVERRGEVDFLAKYVRPNKVDGCYLPEVTGSEPIWNWRP